MDRLWAPWRLDYIMTTLQPSSDCFLCEAAVGGVSREKLVVWHRQPILAIMNAFPYNSGHLLVAPIRHVGDLKDLTTEETTSLFETVRKATLWLDKAYSPHGYNIGLNLGRVAGAGLPGHLHVHIVPRWNGDINFMTVVGETKVMSEGLDAGYDRLLKAIQEIERG